MEKLKKIIDDAYDSGRLPKSLTPYLLIRLCGIYVSLRDGKPAEFIEKEIRDVLVKCKIKVKEKGIGWVAYE